MIMRRRGLRSPPTLVSCARCAAREKGVFGRLSPRGLACVERVKKANRYLPGQILFAQGNAPLAAYCVQSGRFKLSHLTADGRLHILRLAQPGSLLGASNLLAGLPYLETAEALEEASVCVIDGPALRSLLGADPALWESLVLELCARINELQGRLLARAHRPGRAKLAELLLELGGGSGGWKGFLPFSRQDLADMIGVSQETAIRLLGELKRLKIIELKGRRLSLLRPDLLKERSTRA